MSQTPAPPAIIDHYIFRCAVIGIESVGKTSLIEQYVNGWFQKNSLPKTLSSQYFTKENIICGSKNIKLVILDKPMDRDMRNCQQSLARNNFVLLMFDVTNRNSFEALEDEVESFNFKNHNPVKMLFLIGNKSGEDQP